MFYERAKKAVDILGALAGFVVFSPIFLITALAIRFDSPGPIIFVQKRVGKGGKVFGMYKFKSMVNNAEELLQKDPKLLEQYKKGSYKLEDDPRVTRVGRILRKTSMDELPQFLNILKGEMSLVGPRAFKPDELEEQQRKLPESRGDVASVLTAKPGLTGLWQVLGRSEIDFAERVKLDAEYARRRSLLGDIKIILKTPLVVIRCKGAY